jgi:hypothetical protein
MTHSNVTMGMYSNYLSPVATDIQKEIIYVIKAEVRLEEAKLNNRILQITQQQDRTSHIPQFIYKEKGKKNSPSPRLVRTIQECSSQHLGFGFDLI